MPEFKKVPILDDLSADTITELVDFAGEMLSELTEDVEVIEELVISDKVIKACVLAIVNRMYHLVKDDIDADTMGKILADHDLKEEDFNKYIIEYPGNVGNAG